MAGFVKFMGWLAFAAGPAFIILSFIAPDWLSMDTVVLLCVFGLVMGALLVGLAQLIGIAGKIAENTSWFSSGAPASAQETPDEHLQPEPVVAEPEDVRQAELAAADETPAPAEDVQPEQPAGAVEQPVDIPEPELYDANRHPPAVEEWSHHGRRVMTLEDGTFATEVDGAWRRFMRLEEIDAIGN